MTFSFKDDKINVMETKRTIQEEENSFFIFIQLVKKKWLIFFLSGILFGFTGFFFSISKKPIYESRLTFALEDGGGDSNMSEAIGLASQFGINFGGSGGGNVFGSDNIIGIMMSRRIIERTLLSIDTFNTKPTTLIDYYLNELSDKKNNKKNIFPIGSSKDKFNNTQISLLHKVYQDFVNHRIIADKPDKKFNIYQVKFQSPDEKFTKIFTDKLVYETNAFYTEIRSKKAKETLDLLEKRVEFMKENLSSSITTKASVQDANINPAFSVLQAPIQKQQVNIQVYGAAYTELFKNLEIARYQYLKDIPLMQIIDAADYPMIKIKNNPLITTIVFIFISQCLVLFFIFLEFTNNLGKNNGNS